MAERSQMIAEDSCALSLTIEGEGTSQCTWSPPPAAAVIAQVTAESILMPGFEEGDYHPWVGTDLSLVPCSGGSTNAGGFCFGSVGPVISLPAWFRFRVIDVAPGIDTSNDGVTWTTLGSADFGQSTTIVARTYCGSTHCGGSVNMTLGQGIFLCPLAR